MSANHRRASYAAWEKRKLNAPSPPKAEKPKAKEIGWMPEEPER